METQSTSSADFQRSFDLKQIEFQAVLDLTIAINQNKPEKGLYLILENYLLEKLGIGHFSMHLKDETWTNTYGYGKHIEHARHLTDLEAHVQVSLISEAHPTLARANPHIQHLIPFFFDQQLKGFVLCGPLANFPHPFDKEGLALIQTMVSLMVMAIENQKLLAYRLRQEALRKEIEIARQVQQMLFPKQLPDNEYLKIYTSYLPHLDVSGDYYDYIKLSENQFALCVADVSGKGMSAALLMSNFQACLRTLMMQKRGLEDVVRTINTLICQNSNMERFITSFIAVYDSEAQVLSYVNSGHTPPCLVYADGRKESLSLGSTILGIFPNLPHLHIGQVFIQEEVLFIGYTDGLSELEGDDNEEFGIERLESYFIETQAEKLPIMHQRLLNRLDHFTAGKGFNDDITLITARIIPKKGRI